jgi:2-methylisocitrate lyase-like PEP mutase family enzyme
MTDDQVRLAAQFRDLHRPGVPLLMANAWDAGSARLLQAAGFAALASTSSGLAASLGRLDYGVGRDQVVAHAATLAGAVDVPVSADFEDCYSAELDGITRTVAAGREAGLAGCSIEDWDPRSGRLYAPEQAAERVATAARAAHEGEVSLVLTARAENFLRENPDRDDTIARLQAYERAGADVLYAPGMDRPEDLRALLGSVRAPVNVLMRAATPPVAELAELGVSRVSVGGAFAFAAYAAAVRAGRELLDHGTSGYSAETAEGARLVREAFS